MAAVNFAKKDEILQSVLRDAQADQLGLPGLVPPRNALQEWWDSLISSLLSPALQGMRIDPKLFGLVLMYTAIAILVLLVGYLIYRLLFDRKLQARALRLIGHPTRDVASSDPDLLETALSAALKAQNYPLAARLRWALFLRACRLQDGLTLLDYSRTYPRLASTLSAHYPLMFRPGSGAAPEYRNLDETLSTLARETGR